MGVVRICFFSAKLTLLVEKKSKIFIMPVKVADAEALFRRVSFQIMVRVVISDTINQKAGFENT